MIESVNAEAGQWGSRRSWLVGRQKKQRAPGCLITYIPLDNLSRASWGVLSSLKEGASLFLSPANFVTLYTNSKLRFFFFFISIHLILRILDICPYNYQLDPYNYCAYFLKKYLHPPFIVSSRIKSLNQFCSKKLCP